MQNQLIYKPRKFHKINSSVKKKYDKKFKMVLFLANEGLSGGKNRFEKKDFSLKVIS